MLRKVGFALLCAATILSTTTYSMENHALQQGVTVEYDLKPNQPELFTNYMFWEVRANCKITSVDDGNELFAEGLAKKGKINDIILSAGNSMRVTVHHGENLKLSAESGAQVRITNLGAHTIKATCVA